MESELKRILDLDVPVAHLKYKGNSKKYVVWTIVYEEPLFFYEDDIQYSKVTVDIDIYSDSNYLDVMSSIKNIMKQNGWTWEEDDLIDCCYICEADLYISNPDIINKYEYRSNYLGVKVAETDDWCFKNHDGYVTDYQMGGTDCYRAYGISYWNSEDSEKLKTDLLKVYASRGGKENLWEMVPLKLARKNYKLEVRSCGKEDITEIDNFIELVDLDSSYTRYPGYEDYRIDQQ